MPDKAPEKSNQPDQPAPEKPSDQGGTATATKKKPAPTKPKPKQLPPYKVLLHNDDVNDMLHVALALCELTPLRFPEATLKMIEAHLKGVSLILVTHKERAELYQDQLSSKGLTITIEPDGKAD